MFLPGDMSVPAREGRTRGQQLRRGEACEGRVEQTGEQRLAASVQWVSQCVAHRALWRGLKRETPSEGEERGLLRKQCQGTVGLQQGRRGKFTEGSRPGLQEVFMGISGARPRHFQPTVRILCFTYRWMAWRNHALVSAHSLERLLEPPLNPHTQ